MSLRTLTPEEWAARPGEFDTLLDARSPAEFADDRLPDAENWPTLDDAERARVGTLYVRDSALAARKLGAALAARNIAALVEQRVAERPREWRPLVYCWRGGQRSGALALVLDQIGFRTSRLAGGYKAFRAMVRGELATRPAALDWRVLAGPTGSGKTRLLGAIARAGAQVLDLESLAAHRGSVLGALPDRAQPSQRRFDTLLWHALRALDPDRPVFVESESRRIGAVQLPEALTAAMHRRGRVLRIEMPADARAALLLDDYRASLGEPERLADALGALAPLRGRETVGHWQDLARAGRWGDLVAALLDGHYDPLYRRSIDRHYAGFATARPIALAGGDAPALDAVARSLAADAAAGRA